MSQAAIRSNLGDDFQREIVLHWAIRLLSEAEIDSVESEVIADPETKQPILVDDVIVRYNSGKTIYAQCKIDSTDRHGWKLSDKALKAELVKVRDQLKQNVTDEAYFYSQTPFGELKRLLDATRPFHSVSEVTALADGNINKFHSALSAIFERDDNSTFSIYKRISVFSNALEEHTRLNNLELGFHLPNPLAARDTILGLISDHASQRPGSVLKITRENIHNRLAERRIYLCPPYEEGLLIAEFIKASQIGRQDLSRQIAGEKLPRPELTHLSERAFCDGTTIIKGMPGNGKSWLLLEFADLVECNPLPCLLFVKGDRFTTIENEEQLSNSLGLSGLLTGMVERLAEKQRVVLVLDSLDTLSLSGNHLALRTFLSLIDRLDNRPNISIMCACRNFDLAYDPQLRGRQWGCEVVVENLDPDTVVRPFLVRLGVDLENVPDETIKLLGNPQYLKLYEAIHLEVDLRLLRSVQVLQELFLREKIEKNPDLAEPAMTALYAFAEKLADRRSLRCDYALFNAPESMMRHLKSTGVLSSDANTIGFAHQTIFDALWVRKARKDGISLHDFVMSRPALPFYRPAIRAYVMYLHETDAAQFVREMRQLLADAGVAYHVRKLALDTLAGMTANDTDFALCRWLVGHDPDLFRRFLWAAKGDCWFRLFWDNHLIEEGLFASPTHELQRQWLSWVGRKDNNNFREKITVWRRFLSADDEEIRRQIMMDADDFPEWQPEDRDIVETLISWDVKGRVEHLMTGKIIRHFIESTNLGDDILWGYLRHQIMSSEDFPNPYRVSTAIDVHVYRDENFLSNRLQKSECFLTLALNDLLEWVTLCRQKEEDWHPDYLEIYLHATSWERLHNDFDHSPYDGFMMLFDGIEQALTKHAVSRTDLWLEFSPRLFASRELGLMYLAIRGCQSKPEQHADFEELLFLKHPSLLCGTKLTDELWELIHDTSPYLSEESFLTIQTSILEKIESSEDDEKPWVTKHLYNLVSKIPSCYLPDELLKFVNTSSEKYGPPTHKRQIYGGNCNEPPVISSEDFACLSPVGQLKLLKFVNKGLNSERLFRSDLSCLSRVVEDAATADPLRYLALLGMFAEGIVEPEYETAIMEGCAKHLRYRFTNLQPPEGWEALSKPDPKVLARLVLDNCEKHRNSKTDYARNLEACAAVLDTPDDTFRLISLFNFALCEQPSKKRDDDIGSQALNTLQGEATSGACKHFIALSKIGKQIPDQLTELLMQSAKNAYRPARWSLLRLLPSMIRFNEELCWQLFQTCHADNPDDLWDVSYHFIYYTYWKHPERYFIHLDRMSQHQNDEVKKSYGTLLTLYYLSRKIETDIFWTKVTEADEVILAGISNVFVKNLDKPDCRSLCLEGIMWFLDKNDMSKRVKSKIENIFSDMELLLPLEIPIKFIRHVEDADRLHYMLDWLGVKSKHNPEEILEILEVLFKRLRDIERKYIWHSDGLVAASINILRHADLIGDETLINRAIAVQDELIRLHVDKMDVALEEAARN